MLKPGKAEWEMKLFEAAGIPQKLAGEIVQPATFWVICYPKFWKKQEAYLIPCIAVAGHDTASAVVSVPAQGENWAYLSSGTWSLLGIESPVPVVSEKTLEMNFTNEGGVEGTTRFLKNIMGMWLIQECKRIWDTKSEMDWQQIVDLSDAMRSIQKPYQS
jgi:rhamnulokinase